MFAAQLRHRHTVTPPSAWRRIARIFGSLYLVIFIKISSFILARKFYFRIPLVSGGGLPADRTLRGLVNRQRQRYAENAILDSIAARVLDQDIDPQPRSGRQGLLENYVNRFV